MATDTATQTPAPAEPKASKPVRSGFCGLTSHNHERCPGMLRNGNGTLIPCACPEPHPLRCIDCGLHDSVEPGVIDPIRWRCVDSTDCRERRDAKTSANPIVAQIERIQQEVAARREAERAATLRSRVSTDHAVGAARAPRDPRPIVGACRCCGEPTRGGAFLPGHDARYVSLLVAQVVEGKTSAEDAAALLADKPALQAKMAKRLGAAKAGS